MSNVKVTPSVQPNDLNGSGKVDVDKPKVFEANDRKKPTFGEEWEKVCHTHIVPEMVLKLFNSDGKRYKNLPHGGVVYPSPSGVSLENQIINLYEEVPPLKDVNNAPVQKEKNDRGESAQEPERLYIPKEGVTALLHDYSEPFAYAKRKSRLCNEWDPILGRFRHWRTEHKCYKSAVAVGVILCSMLIIYAVVSYQLRNSHMHNYRRQGLVEEKNKYRLEINILEGECQLNVVNKKYFERSIFDTRIGKNNEGPKEDMYTIQTSLSPDYVRFTGTNSSVK